MLPLSETMNFRIRTARALALVILLPWAVIADQTPSASNELPSRPQVLAFVAETIDWYRHLASDQIEGDPADLLFLEGHRTIGVQIVHLSFDFARAAVALEATPAASPTPAKSSTESREDFQRISAMRVKAEAETQQVSDELASLKQKSLKARGQDRKKLDIEIEEAQNRLELLQTRSARYQDLLNFIRSTDPGSGGTGELVLFENLERTVPDAAISGSKAPAAPPQYRAERPSSGIFGKFSDVSNLARNLRAMDDSAEVTNKLAQASQILRTPLIGAIEAALRTPDLSRADQSMDLNVLRQQTSRLEVAIRQATKISPAVAALDKQEVLLAQFQSNLTAFRKSLSNRYRAAWEVLIERLVILMAVIALLVGGAAGLRKLTSHHVHDSNARSAILLVQGVIFWLATAVTVFVAFAFDVTSLATFLGLLTAGVAVALQNVIIAVVAYFVLVGKLGLRVGDRVQLSGVTGDVVEIGLMQFQLRELDAPGQPTGRIVSFSNSFVFVSPATGLFKGIRDTAQNA